MINYYDIEYVCESTDVILSEYNLLMKQWNRLDSVLCLERTDSEKEGIVSKVINLITTILKQTKEMIEKFAHSIDNKVKYLLMSKEEKESFESFKRYVSENSSIKKEEITVKDWNKVKKKYLEIEKNLDDMYKDPSVDYKSLNTKGSELLESAHDIASKMVSALTIDACLSMAENSTDTAKVIQDALNSNSKILNRIESDLGNKENRKFQKKLNALTKESVYRKLKVALLGKKEKDLFECVKDYTKSFKDVMKHPSNKKNIVKAVTDHKHFVKTMAKNYLTDKETRNDVKNIVGVVKDVNNIKKGYLNDTKNTLDKINNFDLI